MSEVNKSAGNDNAGASAGASTGKAAVGGAKDAGKKMKKAFKF